ncbi:DUF937 domain-containing protein [Rhizobium sp. P32RR-XVIII]|uniref:DUF937 domain-containing protein n=1 Tax=Rhizobium sp. P32RR-XVIII TaxID=2726738 RepID=UPI0014573834|nr:DUF937 domain-containing protein [Rhizobium sp. P32RR-XVIII]NLS05813.1 DUF937 domain-containing protein [Rhizobium sp. P32RR-XVIII]
MASNLVSSIMQLLTPDLIGRLAGALGLDAAKTQRAIAAAVPALLAGLGGIAAQSGGAQKIADAARQQGGALGNLAGMLTPNGQTSLGQTGSQILSSLFGAGDSGALANAVGSYAGLDKNASSSLLGMLAPIVMGGVAQQGGNDLSANGVASLLASQKDNIVSALPSGVSDMLGGTGLLSALGGSMRTATGQAAGRAAATASSVSNVSQRTASASAPRRWLYWFIAALVILAALYYIFARPTEQTVPQSAVPTPNLTVGDIDVGKQLTDTLTNLQAAVTGITDAPSAQAALPKLQAAEGEIDKVAATIGQLSAEQKTALAGMLKPMMSTLNGLFDKILTIPGVSDVLKPTVDSLRAKLATLPA